MISDGAVWYGVNLASERLGAKAIYATDDFFAAKERIIADTDAVFIEGKYDEHGKWMDGWESRRKREEGSDYCIIKLGITGCIKTIDIDTRHFTGNYPPAAKLEGCFVEGDINESTEWVDLTGNVSLNADQQHIIHINSDAIFNHVRLTIYPDGGIARLRIYGEPQVDWSLSNETKLDLIAVENGGRAIACNDEHYGSMHNLILPGDSLNMGDGWETRRRREPGNDWVILALGHTGKADSVVVDTSFFKGNFPAGVSIQAAYVEELPDSTLAAQSLYWKELLPQQALLADSKHEFLQELNDIGPITHIRMNIFPDGGVARLRLFGSVVTK